MHIVHIAPELALVAKAGGLGDIVYGLSKALIKEGHTVDIILPKYDCLQHENIENLNGELDNLAIEEKGSIHTVKVWSARCENLPLHLIETSHPDNYFLRATIYGQEDDTDRFLFFSKAAMEYLLKSDTRPDIIHIHDWGTAITAPLLRDVYRAKGLKAGGLVMTIHNLLHQGVCSPEHLANIGLDPKHYLTPNSMQHPEAPDLINLLKGGIVYADQVNTVSPNYECEIKTALGGCGLHDILLKYDGKLRGILNGIDIDYWNPATDCLLDANYSLQGNNIALVQSGKQANKHAMQKSLGLEVSDRPLVSSVTRLVPQKGPELILAAMKRTLEKGGQFVLLGSMAPEHIFKPFQALQASAKYKGQLAISLDHNEKLAHMIYGGADFMLVPSLFEPCGLTQMISMRYGTVPIVRMTGGLADTVFDVDTSKLPQLERNGYTFEFPDEEGVFWALDRALTCYEDKPEKYRQLMLAGMTQDFSWKHTTPDYVQMYKVALSH